MIPRKTFYDMVCLPAWLATAVSAGGGLPEACPEIETSRIRRGPYLQALLGTSVEVVWLTMEPMECKVRFRETGADAWREVATPRDSFHSARLEGLTPGAEHEYEVLDAAEGGDRALARGPGLRFRTSPLPSHPGPVRAVALGDSGIALGDQLAVARMLCRLSPAPDLFLHLGDLDYLGNLDLSVFGPYRELMARTSFYPTHGNHDPRDPDWGAFFFPPRDEPGETALVYSFDWGSAHFTVLDTEEEVLGESPQIAFLREDLARARARSARWLILYFHVPPYTVGAYANDVTRAKVHAVIPPIVDELGVDLVLSGHDHNYQRSHPLRGNAPVDRWQDPEFVSPTGALYVVSGGGGHNQLYPELPASDHSFHRLFLLKHHALEISITPDELVLRAIRPCELEPEAACEDGTIVIDQFTIRKDRPRLPVRFLRGDADLSGSLDLADAMVVLNHLFLGGGPLECPPAADSDGSGLPIIITDPIYLLYHLFVGGPPPPSPFPECGDAPEADGSSCARAGCGA